MSIFQRYIFIKFLKALFVTLALFIGLFLIVLVVEELSNILKYTDRLTLSERFQYFLYYIPYTFMFSFPLATLFTTVYILGQLHQNNELIGIYNSGIALSKVTIPIFVFTFLICGLMYLFEEPALFKPYRIHKDLHLKLKGSTPSENRIRRELTLFGKENMIYVIRYYNPVKKMLRDVHIVYLDDKLNFSKIFSAKSMVFQKKQNYWIASDADVKIINPSNNKTIFSNFKSYNISLPDPPDHFDTLRTDFLDRSSRYILKSAKKVAVIGGNTKKWYTEYHFKVSTHFVAFVLLFLGLPLAVMSRKVNAIISLVYVLIIFFVFILLHPIGKGLGTLGYLPPLVGGWIANIIFILSGIFLQRKLLG